MKTKILFIVNPIAGNGKSAKSADSIGKWIDRERFDFAIAQTEHRGHATELARQAAAAGFDVVAAIGGDGTVNETACGLVGTRTALAIIPHGSGDGLALHLQIPRNVRGAMQVINSGSPMLADSGIVCGHRFFTTTGVGYDAKVAYDYAQAHSRGLKTYIAKALADWRSYEPANYIITTESERVETRAMLVTVGNANQWGNRCHITPLASIADGLLEVTIVRPITTLQAPGVLRRLFRYDAYSSPHIMHLQARNITIERSHDFEAHFDGEAILLPARVEVQCCAGSLYIWR